MPARLDRERLLAVDLREMRQVAVRTVRRRRPDLARQAAAVDVQGGAEDEQRDACLGRSLSHPPRSRDVRRLGVVGVSFGQRSGRLRGQQIDDLRWRTEQVADPVADVHCLDPSPGRCERVELRALGREPVVGEHDLVSLG